MLSFHHVTLTLLLTAGPFRIACHATTGEGAHQRPAEMCSVEEQPQGEEREAAEGSVESRERAPLADSARCTSSGRGRSVFLRIART